MESSACIGLKLLRASLFICSAFNVNKDMEEGTEKRSEASVATSLSSKTQTK